MVKKTDVSFVMTVYNKAYYLPSVLTALLGQSGLENPEFIFIDDHSSDESVDIIKKYTQGISNVTIIANEDNRGISPRINQGIALAKGEFVRMLDSDDIFPLDSTEIMLKLARKHQADMVYGCFVKTGKEPAALEREKTGEFQYKYNEDALSTVLTGRFTRMGQLIKTEVLKKAHGADERVFIQDESIPLRAAVYALGIIKMDANVVLVPKEIGNFSGNKLQLDHDRFMAALGIDSMVKKEYRDYFNFHDMIVSCQKRLKEDGCVLRIGFPNDNSYPILKKGLRHKDIGRLTTYCMIRNIGAVKPSLAFLNSISRLGGRLQYLISFLSVGKKVYHYKYHKDRESFDAVRYKWFGGDYRKVEKKGIHFVYKIMPYKGVDTAFLLDVWPLSRTSFEMAVRHIYKHERKKIDMILYVGSLSFTPWGLWTIPHRYEPKHFNFTCNPLTKGYFDESLYDIRNWEVNLSNYDLL